MSGLKLTEKEKKWLIRLETDYKGAILRYISGAILIAIAIIYFTISVQSENINDRHKALLFGILGSVFIIVQYVYKIFYLIIKKMRDYIEELEKINKSP